MKKLADRFMLEREIGSGGMSVVYLGRDEVLDRPVAVKVLKPGFEGSDVGARFSREGRTAARLSHPNVVQVYDAGQADLEGREVSYIVMEYISGGDLMDLLAREGPFTGEKLAFLSEAAAGLAFAHEKGVVHRDIKPHNILVDDHGRPKLSDFGIARALDATHTTQTGFYLGTALYSSPEQLQGHRAGTKSDIYSLGATLYHAVVGELLFTGSPIEVASQHVTQEPTPPTERGALIDADTEAMILACLAKDPGARPSAEEVEAALAKARTPEQTSQTRPQPVPPPTPEPKPTQHTAPSTPPSRAPARRRSWAPILAIVVLLALLGVSGAMALPAILGDGNTGQGNGNTGQGSSGNPDSGADSGAAAGAGSGTERASQGSSNAGGQGSGSSGEQAQAEDPSGGTSASANGGEGDAGNAAADAAGDEAAETAAAEAVVEEFYSSAASGDYGRSAELLSTGFRQSTFPDESVFQNTFSTLESVEFVDGPTAQVSGETATVDGVTMAQHTDRTERNTGTWTLVKESGEWKLDSVSVQTTQV